MFINSDLYQPNENIFHSYVILIANEHRGIFDDPEGINYDFDWR